MTLSSARASSPRTRSPAACPATSTSLTASSPSSRTSSCGRNYPNITPACARSAARCSPGCHSSAIPMISYSTTRSSPMPFPLAPGSARCLVRLAMRPTRRRSTCAGASDTASGCCAPADSTGSTSTGCAVTPTSTSIPPQYSPGPSASRLAPTASMHSEKRRMPKSPDADTTVRQDGRPAGLPGGTPEQAPRNHSTERAEREGTPGRRHLTIASVVLLLFAVVSAASGQVMLKHGMQIATARAAHSGGSLALRAATSPWVLLGLVVFGVSAVAWLAALSRVPLSVAYPFNALGYLVILTASIVVLHERASVLTWVGSLMVVSGLLVVVLTKP